MPSSTKTPAHRDRPGVAWLALAGLVLLGLPACLSQGDPVLPGTTEPRPTASTPQASEPATSEPTATPSQPATSATPDAGRGTATASASASADYADSAGASGSFVDCANEYSYLQDLATDQGTVAESRMWEITREMAEAQRLAESGDETSAYEICRMVVDDIRYALDQG